MCRNSAESSEVVSTATATTSPACMAPACRDVCRTDDSAEFAPGQAWERRKISKTETSRSVPAGVNPSPAKASSQPVPSVAWSRGNSGYEALHRECTSRVMEPRKETACGSRHGILSADSIRVPLCKGFGPAGVGEHGTDTRGRTGTWEILPCPLNIREATPVTKTRLCVVAQPRRERTTEPSAVTAPRRKRSGVGCTSGSRSSSLYRGSGRTSPEGIPWRKGRAGRRNRWRERCQGPRALITSYRNCNG